MNAFIHFLIPIKTFIMSQIIIRVKQFITIRFINPIKSFYWVHFINPMTKWSFRFLRNPYYFFPIFFAVLILLGSGSLSDFLKCYMRYSIIVFAYFTWPRTREPFFLIEVLLVLTTYFIGYQEARNFCVVFVFLMCLLVPIISCFLSYVLLNG